MPNWTDRDSAAYLRWEAGELVRPESPEELAYARVCEDCEAWRRRYNTVAWMFLGACFVLPGLFYALGRVMK